MKHAADGIIYKSKRLDVGPVDDFSTMGPFSFPIMMFRTQLAQKLLGGSGFRFFIEAERNNRRLLRYALRQSASRIFGKDQEYRIQNSRFFQPLLPGRIVSYQTAGFCPVSNIMCKLHGRNVRTNRLAR